MRLRFDTFLGEIPRRDPKMLPQGAATRAQDVDMASGALRPMRASVAAHTMAEATTHFIAYDGQFLRQTARTSFAPGPVADDRLYIATEGSAPRLREMDNGTEHTLALPTPTAPPSVSLESVPTVETYGAKRPYDANLTETEFVIKAYNDILGREPDEAGRAFWVGQLLVYGVTREEVLLELERHQPPDETPAVVETRLYATTWVTDLDEETPPSPLSNSLDVPEGATVRVNILDFNPPAGTRINRIRVYCSQTSATGATGLYFIKELSAGTSVYVHNFDNDPLQEVLPSADYDPPVATLQGLTPLWNGMIAGFSGRSLYFCEPFIPHAWPIKYELKTDYPIVGLAANGQFLAILTTGTPYVAQGSAPENMLIERLDANMPCVSAEGIADIGMGVLFPSHEGLVLMQGGSMQVISRELFDRRAWRALNPETIRAAHFHGRYLFSYAPDDGDRRTVIVDMNGETPGLVRSSQSFSASAYDLVGGRLYISDGTTTIREFDADTGGALSMKWDSGIIHIPGEVPFGAIRVDGHALSSMPVVAVYADGVLNAIIHEFNSVQRLAPGYADEWQVRVNGAANITRITMAGSPDELLG